MAAGLTYVPIATQTISGSTTSTITFSSIPSTYTDLVLVANIASGGGGDIYMAQLNSDTSLSSTNYSQTLLYADGSTVAAYENLNYPVLFLGYMPGTSSNTFSTTISHFMNYANTASYKTVLSQTSDTTNVVGAAIGIMSNLWRNTAAISTITLLTQNSTGYKVGSTLSLYGIAAA